MNEGELRVQRTFTLLQTSIRSQTDDQPGSRLAKARRQVCRIADRRASDREGPPHHREGECFAIAVSAPCGRIDRRHRATAIVPGSAKERRHFFLQMVL